MALFVSKDNRISLDGGSVSMRRASVRHLGLGWGRSTGLKLKSELGDDHSFTEALTEAAKQPEDPSTHTVGGQSEKTGQLFC
jgi:hypothetical protein